MFLLETGVLIKRLPETTCKLLLHLEGFFPLVHIVGEEQRSQAEGLHCLTFVYRPVTTHKAKVIKGSSDVLLAFPLDRFPHSP